MTLQLERRLRTVAQIAHYGTRLGLLPYQIDEAVRIAVCQLDRGKSGTTAYQAGRKVLDLIAKSKSSLQA